MTNKEIGETIRTMRTSRNMTQKQLGDAIGASASSIGMYENGRRRPTDEVAEALADVFNVPVWAIRYSEDEIIPKDEAGEPRTVHTIEGEILASGIDQLPEEFRKRAFDTARRIIDEYADFFRKGVRP